MRSHLAKKSREELDAVVTQLNKLRSTIRYVTSEWTVEYLVDKFDADVFVIPDYQRRFVWDPVRQSRFIESLLIGYPIPFLFVAVLEDARQEIVDGAQRIRTMRAFIRGELRLTKLKKLTTLNQFTYEDLPEAVQRRLLARSLRLIVLDEGTEATAREEMFDRINTSPMKANEMEVRIGAQRGPFLTLVLECANHAHFKRLTPMAKKKIDRREREELVLRFFAYGDRYQDFDHDVNRFLDEYLEEANTWHPSVIDDKRKAFFRMLDFVEQHISLGFRRDERGKATPRARFEAIAVGVHLALETGEPLDTDMSWLDSTEFKAVTSSDQSNTKSRFLKRVTFVRDQLCGTHNEKV